MNKLVNKTIRSNLGLFKASSYPTLSVMSNLAQFSINSANANKLNLFPDKAYIGGNWVESISARKFEVKDPATSKLLGKVPDCTTHDINLAVNAANEAFQVWSNYTAEQRSKLLKKLADLHLEHKQTLVDIITYENGKPLRESTAEIEISAKSYEWFAEEAKRTYGDLIPATAANKRFLVVKQPVGVCGFITPWNFPAYMIARKAAAALAAGCTIVIKPAEDTPYSALALCQLVEMAGFPKGCVNVVTTSRKGTPAVGKQLCEHPLVRKISFTGSTAVGKMILSQCATGVKKVQMELGGNAPFVVFESANIEKAVNGLLASKFRNSGQTCICPNRVIVQDSIHDKFVDQLVKKMQEQIKVGSGFDQNTTQGPLINKAALDKVSRLIEDSKSKGAKVVSGGKPCNIEGGNFFEPTLITSVDEQMEISKEEIFGPVVSIIKFKTEDEAIRIANSTSVGLAGYFYSSDLSQIWRVAEKMEVGMVGANESVISTIEAPFGGIKQSGFGSEGSKYGINEYLNNKYICMGI